MPKVGKKLSRSNYMIENGLSKMDFEIDHSNGSPAKDGATARNVGAAAEWIEKCGEIPDEITTMYENMKSAAADNKKRKSDLYTDDSVKMWQKNFGDTMKKQVDKRKRSSESLLRSLSALVARLEADGNVLQENDQRLQQWCTAQMKMSQQSLAAHRQKLQALKQIHAEYMKECEETEASQLQENKKLEKELASNITALQEKLQQECRRKNVEAFRKAMSMMMDA